MSRGPLCFSFEISLSEGETEIEPDKDKQVLPPLPSISTLKEVLFCYHLRMIKKTTLATFKDGTYKGEYDWTGGIPLSQGELITIVVGQSELQYKLVSKTTRLV